MKEELWVPGYQYALAVDTGGIWGGRGQNIMCRMRVQQHLLASAYHIWLVLDPR